MANGNQADLELKAKIEAQRVKTRKLMLRGGFLLGGCAFVSIVLIILRDTGTIDLGRWYVAFPLAVVGCAGVFELFKFFGEAGKLKVIISDNLVRGVLEEFFTVKSLNTNAHFGDSTIRAAGFVHGWERIYGSDHVIANYKGLELAFCVFQLIERFKCRFTAVSVGPVSPAVILPFFLIIDIPVK